MLYPSPAEWAEWGIADECHQFFCLHWTELFDLETPDTWQVRACNIKTILRELIEASRIADYGFDAYRGVIRSILDEAFSILKRDVILESCYPFVSAYLAPWAKGEIARDAVPEIERLAIVLLGNLDNYWPDGVRLLKEMLQKADKGKKKDLYDLTMNVAVETVSRGRSPNRIRTTFLDTVLTKSAVPFLDRVTTVFGQYGTQGTKYTCYFLTLGVKKKDEEALPSDINLGFGKPAGPADSTDPFFGAGYNPWLSVNVDAADSEEARSRAEKRLGEVYAGLNLFSIDDRYGIKVSNALVRDGTGAKRIIGHRRLGSHYLGSYDSKLLKVDMLFRVQQRLQGTSLSDAAQLAAAVEYHRLALLATSDEARLVNLWIALEALCQGGDGSIIERVWSRISPCVSVENVRKSLISLSIYVKELWDHEDPAPFLALFPNSTENRLEPSDLAAVLLLPLGHADLKKLCDLCAKHPLILHRLFRAKTMMLSEAKAIASNLELTCRNVEWQIKRIYRVRNAIVHTGSATVPLPQLTQHLHCYLIKAIHTVLIDLDRQPRWTIRDSLEHRLKLFKYVVDFFRETPDHEIGTVTITDPAACMGPQTAPFAWLPPAPVPAAP
jgi:hypothetical protein